MATRIKKKTRKKAPAKKKTPGSPVFVPTARMRKLVREMVEMDLPQTTIARFITNPDTNSGISPRNLAKHFKAELGDKKRGMPAFKPDARMKEQVLKMIGYGMNEEEIASIITSPRTDTGISRLTLVKHFKPELDQGHAETKYKVLDRVYTTACSPDHPGATTAGIFLCKTRYGYSERHEISITEGTGVLVAPREVAIDVWIDGVEKTNASKRSPVDDD